jgi:exonuclease SbcC
MSYRDNVPELSFESIHTACISGNNGHGKSALIDAITWALWGESRAGSDNDLIHSGQSEVEVDFEFAVNRQNYRILRKHSKPKSARGSGQTILEFQSVTPEGYKTLSAETVTQTQNKIIQTLHMDYDTFINSAFIRQGKADEFTKKRPAERKQVLANILQLSLYDALENKTKEKLREQSDRIMQTENLLKSFQEELAEKPRFETEHSSATAQLIEAEKALSEHNRKLETLRRERALQESRRSQINEIDSHILSNESNLKSWQQQLETATQRIQALNELLVQKESITAGYQALQRSRTRLQEMDQKYKQVNSLVQRKYTLDKIITQANEKLNSAHSASQKLIMEWEGTLSDWPELQQRQAKLEADLQSLAEKETAQDKLKEQLKQKQAELHEAQARQKATAKELQELAEKLKMLSHPEGATCPLCESELGPDGQKRIEEKYRRENTKKEAEMAALKQTLTILSAAIQELESSISKADTEIRRQRSGLLSQKGSLEKSQAVIAETNAKVETEKLKLQEIEAQLAGRQYAQQEQSLLEEIDKTIADLAYSPEEHEKLRLESRGLEQYEKPFLQLQQAVERLQTEEAGKQQAGQNIAELKNKISEHQARKLTLLAELDKNPDTAADLASAEQQYQSLLDGQRRLQEVVGASKSRLDRLTEVENRTKTQTEILNRSIEREKIYKDLMQAFGKKGLQAMLIEMAIPEIENEANRLLARMTDNRMSLKMETQKETKKGDVQETLDINISDELGTRNYEMFSGGESFRIDFAIRIALSRLLARRAGAPLPTLIIDEGFGTQDGTGIEKIKDAITSIQDDFEKILVITHINDFKDAFPVRIEVVKTPEGSTLYLN